MIGMKHEVGNNNMNIAQARSWNNKVQRQGRGDEGLDLRFVLELGQVQGVDGCGDRRTCLQLRVGFAPGVAVRFDEDGVVQVLEAGGQGAGHRQVAQHVAAPQQVEGGSAGPGLAVAQRHRRRDGCVRLGRGVIAREGRCEGGVRLGAGVIHREGCCDGGVLWAAVSKGTSASEMAWVI